ncbi:MULTISPECIES: LysR family transcriptional regulator [Ramlibacter]|uniref:LysR family transcriptional regulator n=1 Tax=Ramlibacter aquaticus TaxID=2780094 RepID=A0ABR9SIM7_9BURK|nr:MULTISPECIES: LysR family transcriptional regulator [Ramlibacter]MBE7941597.1 LysR family transcriptional regulator [Ramlibacter aquaticus]
MSRFDWTHLDAHALQLLLTVLETRNVTQAAMRLGVTQSAVSHGLDKLREITGDPLFVKAGRGIAATARAESLGTPARELLHAMQRFARNEAFDPLEWEATLTIAANDFQRDLLLPALAERLRRAAPRVNIRVIPSALPHLEMLRDDNCQLVISPRPPEGADIVQKRLFEDDYRVFYDPARRDAPLDEQDYLAAEHATVVYPPSRPLDLDQQLAARGVRRRIRVMVPGFGALPAFLRGSKLLATAPAGLAHHTLQGFAHAPVPLQCPTLPMYAVWHARYQQDPAHRWLRAQLDEVVAEVMAHTLATA